MQLQTKPSPKDYSVYFLLFAIGLLVFFTITFTFSFKEKVFQAFFDKPFSFAQSTDDTSKVNLIVGIGSTFKIGVVNIENGKSNIILRWKTTNSPKSCTGRFWSNVKKSDNWVGSKNVSGGDYVITDNLQTGIYVYSINCTNESGDSSGANIIINAGAKQSYLQPHITEFKVVGEDGHQYDLNKLNSVNQNSKLTATWSAINTETSYGVCVANGSWPIIYQNTGNFQIKEQLVLDQVKIYKYSIFCSNENGYDSQEISFIVR